jgi:tRNA(Ile)-lysidine synthase
LKATLLDRVAECLARLKVGSEAMVVAVSGGPDSVALARLLVDLQDLGRAGPLVLAHVNHQLRGVQSDADEVFVSTLAKKVNVERLRKLTFCSERIDVKSLARMAGENLESIARQVRYEALARMARTAGARWVATGHTADDQAETVLHRLLRGTGLHGLAGIPEQRELGAGIHVIRPMLHITRAEVTQYLADIQQPFQVDSTNVDLEFTRNRIRHELLPQLARDYNPAVAEILSRLAEQAREAQTLIDMQAAELLAAVELPRAGAVLVLRREMLAQAPRHLVREMLRLVWKREHWPEGAMDFAHWDYLAALVQTEDSSLDLPDGIRARALGRIMQLTAPTD